MTKALTDIPIHILQRALLEHERSEKTVLELM